MTKWNRLAALVMSLSLVLAACGGGGPSPVPVQPSLPPEAPGESRAPAESKAPADPFLPVASGERREEKGGAAVDYSHTADGYVMARRGEPNGKRTRLRVTGPGTEYTYDLTEEWAAFPLSDGSGAYRAEVFEQVEGTSYILAFTAAFDAALSSPFAPFLRPNQYVDYTHAPGTVEKARELTQGCAGAWEKVERVYGFVAANLSYDQVRADTVQSGYLPELDQVLEDGKGICLDYAALMTAMLRSQNIPCKLVVGQANTAYHAWVSVWDGSAWRRMDPTFAASGTDAAQVSYTEGNFF